MSRKKERIEIRAYEKSGVIRSYEPKPTIFNKCGVNLIRAKRSEEERV